MQIGRVMLSEKQSLAHLLVPRNSPVNGGIDHSVQTHAEKINVAMHLFMLVLAYQCPQLLVFVLNHLNGIFQRTYFNLKGNKTYFNSVDTSLRFIIFLVIKWYSRIVQ